MPFSHGVVHDAGNPLRPSISITHSRQLPNASSASVAQSLGTCTPASVAARITDVPAGTVTATPSICSVTWLADVRAGVPPSRTLFEYMRLRVGTAGAARRPDAVDGGRTREVLGEVVQ